MATLPPVKRKKLVRPLSWATFSTTPALFSNYYKPNNVYRILRMFLSSWFYLIFGSKYMTCTCHKFQKWGLQTCSFCEVPCPDQTQNIEKFQWALPHQKAKIHNMWGSPFFSETRFLVKNCVKSILYPYRIRDFKLNPGKKFKEN